MTNYIHYSSKTMDPCSLGRGAYEEAKATWLCTGCCSPKPSVKRVDVHIQEERPDGPLNIVNGCGVALARRSFLMRFGEERVAKHLGLGEVYRASGSIIPDWVTFIGRHMLFVRGSRNATSTICSECGQGLYFAMGRRYLCPQPADDVELFESHLWGLIVPEGIAEAIGIGEPESVWVERLEVLSAPLDGLPALAC